MSASPIMSGSAHTGYGMDGYASGNTAAASGYSPSGGKTRVATSIPSSSWRARIAARSSLIVPESQCEGARFLFGKITVQVSLPDTISRCAALTIVPAGSTNPEPTYLPLRSSLGHSILTTAEKIASRLRDGNGGGFGKETRVEVAGKGTSGDVVDIFSPEGTEINVVGRGKTGCVVKASFFPGVSGILCTTPVASSMNRSLVDDAGDMAAWVDVALAGGERCDKKVVSPAIGSARDENGKEKARVSASTPASIPKTNAKILIMVGS